MNMNVLKRKSENNKNAKTSISGHVMRHPEKYSSLQLIINSSGENRWKKKPCRTT